MCHTFFVFFSLLILSFNAFSNYHHSEFHCRGGIDINNKNIISNIYGKISCFEGVVLEFDVGGIKTKKVGKIPLDCFIRENKHQYFHSIDHPKKEYLTIMLRGSIPLKNSSFGLAAYEEIIPLQFVLAYFGNSLKAPDIQFWDCSFDQLSN